MSSLAWDVKREHYVKVESWNGGIRPDGDRMVAVVTEASEPVRYRTLASNLKFF